MTRSKVYTRTHTNDPHPVAEFEPKEPKQGADAPASLITPSKTLVPYSPLHIKYIQLGMAPVYSVHTLDFIHRFPDFLSLPVLLTGTYSFFFCVIYASPPLFFFAPPVKDVHTNMRECFVCHNFPIYGYVYICCHCTDFAVCQTCMHSHPFYEQYHAYVREEPRQRTCFISCCSDNVITILFIYFLCLLFI